MMVPLRIAFCSTLLLLSISKSEACSCMHTHPQSYACSSDFVIVARVKKMFPVDKWSNGYKLKIKREFKINEKASAALKSGRVLTAKSEAACGVKLQPEETYLITGRLSGGKPYVSLCNFIVPWSQVTTRQRKGFRLLYRQGCSCKVISCPWWQCPKSAAKQENGCLWETSFINDSRLPDCQKQHAVCMRSPGGGCDWSGDRQYKECMKLRRTMKEERLAVEP